LGGRPAGEQSRTMTVTSDGHKKTATSSQIFGGNGRIITAFCRLARMTYFVTGVDLRPAMIRDHVDREYTTGG